jgi:type IV pilus assembly protein PilN
MIRINLLGGERHKTKKAFAFDPGAQMTVVCSLILVLGVSGIGLWYWSLTSESSQLDEELSVAQRDAVRLASILTEVKQFEGRQQQLQQRVSLIQQLRRGQSVPVELLDHVSRSLPDALWLTNLEETGANVTIEGRSTTLIALSDFVGNLGTSTLIKKPIEIVNSLVEPAPAGSPGTGDVIRFTVKATLAEQATGPATAAAPAPAAGAKR